MSMNQEFITKIDKLYQCFIAYDAQQTDRISRYRNIEPESAQFIAMLIRIQQSKRILEIGTSTGYSTLWLADAAQTTGGRVTTIEIDPIRTATAKKYADEFELSKWIDFHVGDAQIFIKNLVEDHSKIEFDLILLDAERIYYLDYWPYLQQLIGAKNGVLIVDNVISHAQEVEGFLKVIKEDDRFMSTTLGLGAGLFMVTVKN